jgi:hypothetical protein
MKKLTLLTLAMIFASVSAFAQGGMDEKLFEELHGHASFNVVFTVLAVILVGIIVALWRLDVKVNKLLKEVKK